jgi:hypothetical protein
VVCDLAHNDLLPDPNGIRHCCHSEVAAEAHSRRTSYDHDRNGIPVRNSNRQKRTDSNRDPSEYRVRNHCNEGMEDIGLHRDPSKIPDYIPANHFHIASDKHPSADLVHTTAKRSRTTATASQNEFQTDSCANSRCKYFQRRRSDNPTDIVELHRKRIHSRTDRSTGQLRKSQSEEALGTARKHFGLHRSTCRRGTEPQSAARSNPGLDRSNIHPGK